MLNVICRPEGAIVQLHCQIKTHISGSIGFPGRWDICPTRKTPPLDIDLAADADALDPFCLVRRQCRHEILVQR